MTVRIIYTGTIEYLSGTVTANVTIGADVVAVSFDRVTWYPAAWTGPTGTTQTWQLLLGALVPLPSTTNSTVFVRVTDNPEAPVMNAGTLTVR